jgi:hypothetical protein
VKRLIQVFEDVLRMLNMTSLIDRQCIHVRILNQKRSRTYILEKYQGYCKDPYVDVGIRICQKAIL